MSDTLFTSYKLGSIELKNRIAMAPMTRSRAIDNIPNDIMAEYYAMRADAGLLITEGTAPAANGLGYARIPGLFNQAQADGWRKVTDAVHANNGHIFVQLMHVGRVGHPDNLPDGAELVAPSAIGVSGQMYTDTKGPQDHPTPRAMNAEDIEEAIESYVHSAKLAIEAGFDGIELHGANGYLIDQFLHPGANIRDDEYGGSAENRNRFAIEVATRTAAAIGADRVGIRISPKGVFNDIIPFEGIESQFISLARALGQLNLAYLHMVDHSAMGAPEISWSFKNDLKEAFDGTFILSGGYDNAERANVDLNEDRGDLVAYGRAFLANPDLVTRLKKGAELNDPDHDTFYTPGKEGYIDYPTLDD